LYEKDGKTPMVEMFMDRLLDGCVEGNPKDFLDGLVEKEDEDSNPASTITRIRECSNRTMLLLSRLVASAVERLKLEMKEFWTAA